MIRINLFKPGIMVYDTPEPSGIMDIKKLETNRKIKPCLFEVVWDKEDFKNKIIKLQEGKEKKNG
ncbi:MAG: hypothetical protein KAV87_06190 [Desulfobacteraceae bacterium]|nr:hypothetical protein [Desulfobacteraceae bacterium]